MKADRKFPATSFKLKNNVAVCTAHVSVHSFLANDVQMLSIRGMAYFMTQMAYLKDTQIGVTALTARSAEHFYRQKSQKRLFWNTELPRVGTKRVCESGFSAPQNDTVTGQTVHNSARRRAVQQAEFGNTGTVPVYRTQLISRELAFYSVAFPEESGRATETGHGYLPTAEQRANCVPCRAVHASQDACSNAFHVELDNALWVELASRFIDSFSFIHTVNTCAS